MAGAPVPCPAARRYAQTELELALC